MLDYPIIDFHVHPGPRWIPVERRLHEIPIKAHFEPLIQTMDQENIEQAVTFLLDEDLFRTEAGEEMFRVLKAEGWDKRLKLCPMFEIFRLYETEEVLGYVDNAAKLGISGIKVHPSIQRITQRDLPLLKPLGEKANEHGLFMVVHVYGYQPDVSDNVGVEAVATLAPIVKTPLVVAHAGGLDLPKVVGLAQKYSHIVLDLSYLLELEEVLRMDVTHLIGFAINNLGTDRILYGSDYPSCNARKYKERCLEIFQSLGLSVEEIRAIMRENALQLFKRARQHQSVSY